MQSWSDIPNEILNIITIYCGKDRTQVKWMFVNKHWFTFYLSQVYSTIQTSLRNERIINKILDSPFDIGKHVKHVKLYNLQKPKDLNKIDLSSNLLSSIMKRTPNVQQVSILRGSNASTDYTYKDWLYFSVALISTNSWKLQLLPTLGVDNIISAAYYYTCAHYSRYSLNNLELSAAMINSKDFNILIDFTALKSLEVHENLVNGLTDLESLLQYTPNLQELTVRFTPNRTYQPMKKKYLEAHPSIKKLSLYNFTPQHNDELLIFEKILSALHNLYISGEEDKKWLSRINNPLLIKSFFNHINLISKYDIMIPGDNQEIAFYESWLKTINNLDQDIHLLLYCNEQSSPTRSRLSSNAVATFYDGSIQHTPFLKYALTYCQSSQNIDDILSVLNGRRFLCLKISNVWNNLSTILSKITAEGGYYLKRIVFFNCTIVQNTPQINTTSKSQSIKHIVFQDCKMDFIPLKEFIRYFDSLDYIEFNNCMFKDVSGELIDMSNTDIKSMKIKDPRRAPHGYPYDDRVQIIISISIYFVTENLTRYYSIIDDVMINSAKRTFDFFRKSYNMGEVVVLYVRVKSMQKLSLKIVNSSKSFNLSFHSQESSLA